MEGNGYIYDLMGNREDEENLRWITKTNKKTGTTIELERKKVWDYQVNPLNQYSDVLALTGTITTPVDTGTTNTGSTSTGSTSTGSTTNTGITNTGTTSTGTTNTGSTNSGSTDTATGATDDNADTGSLQGRLLYDNNGNLIGNLLNNKRQYEYIYDANNILIEVSRYNTVNQKEVLIDFTYDVLGRRTSKKVTNQLTEYLYSGNDVIEETLSTVNPTSGAKTKKELREYTYGSKGTDDIVSLKITPFTRVNKIDIPGTSNIYYYQKDHEGSIIKITSSTGSIIEQYSYTVFGKAYKKNPTGVYKPLTSLKSSIGNTRLYTGREYDREITLYYNRARYYDPSLGRFISRDPIGMRDNVNLYTYVGNNPVMYADPTGLIAKEALINAGYYVGSFGYELIDNQAFGLVERNLGIYQSDNLTNAELIGKNDADTVSRNLNALLILAGISGQIGGNTTIVIGFSSCIPSAGGGCVMSAAGFVVDVVSAGVVGYGSSAELYMLSKSNGGSGGGNGAREYKKTKSGLSGKERANDTPSWANGQKPYVGENGKEFAKRTMDQNYGKGNWETKSDRLKEFSQIKKYGDRNFENP